MPTNNILEQGHYIEPDLEALTLEEVNLTLVSLQRVHDAIVKAREERLTLKSIEDSNMGIQAQGEEEHYGKNI
jgi:hypothetical protein